MSPCAPHAPSAEPPSPTSQAAEGNRLDSQTYIRLNMALLTWQGITSLNFLAQPDAITDPALWAGKLAVAVPCVVICSLALKVWVQVWAS